MFKLPREWTLVNQRRVRFCLCVCVCVCVGGGGGGLRGIKDVVTTGVGGGGGGELTE